MTAASGLGHLNTVTLMTLIIYDNKGHFSAPTMSRAGAISPAVLAMQAPPITRQQRPHHLTCRPSVTYHSLHAALQMQETFYENTSPESLKDVLPTSMDFSKCVTDRRHLMTVASCLSMCLGAREGVRGGEREAIVPTE